MTQTKTESMNFDALARDLSKLDPEQLSIRQNPKLLMALGLLTRDGKLNHDARRKLKQIYHLLRQLLPFMERLFSEIPNPLIVDAGAGKAYLGFILYDLILGPSKNGRLHSLESRPELVQKCQELASSFASERLSFEKSSIADAQISNAHMICALHACDTATDDAIVLALKNEVRFVALVPCCQAEVAHLLKDLPKGDLWPLWRHGIHAREFGSHLTNVLRCLVLESRGYKIQVNEFTGWEHSLKNEVILGEKIQRANALAQKQLDALLEKLPVKPKLFSDLATLGL